MEKSNGWWILLSSLKILINHVAGDGTAGESSPKGVDDEFLQKGRKGDRVEIANGQALLIERSCEVGGA